MFPFRVFTFKQMRERDKREAWASKHRSWAAQVLGCTGLTRSISIDPNHAWYPRAAFLIESFGLQQKAMCIIYESLRNLRGLLGLSLYGSSMISISSLLLQMEYNGQKSANQIKFIKVLPDWNPAQLTGQSLGYYQRDLAKSNSN